MRTTEVPQHRTERHLLESMREEAQQAVLRLERELHEAKGNHSRAVERLAHLQALLALDESGEHVARGETDMKSRPASSSPARIARGQQVDSRAVNAAVDVLKTAGAPMHYREIYAAIEREGVLIRSSNPANTLLTRMLRDGRFKPASGRGFYELTLTGDHQHHRALSQRRETGAA
ncbi:MAG TPA: HTH domain-containing protein [Candidatus Limnocylindria bacterium]